MRQTASHHFFVPTPALILCIVCLAFCVEAFDHEKVLWEPKRATTRRPNSHALWTSLKPIPHTIHLTWKDNDVLSKHNDTSYIRNGVQRLIDLNPGWRWHISNDDEVDSYIRAKLDPADYALIQGADIIEKTDLWRLLKIFHEGGYYQDLDLPYNQPFQTVVRSEARCVLPTYGNVNFRQDLMLCAAASPFHQRAIELNLERRRTLGARARTVGDILWLGPQTYKDAIYDVLELDRSATLSEAVRRANVLQPEVIAHHNGKFDVFTYVPGALPLYTGGSKEDFLVESNVEHWTKRAQGRVYCMMPTRWTTAEQVKWNAALDTWGASCNVFKLFLPASDVSPTDSEWVSPSGRRAQVVALNLTLPVNCGDKSCRNIWDKVREAWAWVYEHDRHQADWFVKTDSDTYLWPSNLRRLVSKRGWDPADTHYFGHVLRHENGNPMVAGSSTVLSAEALHRFVLALGTDDCKLRDGVEEPPLARCLRTVGVHASDAFDEEGKETFMVFDVGYHLSMTKGDWWYFHNTPQTHWEEDCCSSSPVAFHYLTPQKMRTVDRFLRLGIGSGLSPKEQRYLSTVNTP